MRGPKLTVYPKGVLLETYRRRLIALRDDGFNDDFMAALEEVHRQLEKHDALAARLAEEVENAATYKQERDEICVNYETVAAKLSEAHRQNADLMAIIDKRDEALGFIPLDKGMDMQDELREVKARLAEAERLLRKWHGSGHYDCEDGWYSCPMHPDYAGHDDPNHCSCGHKEIAAFLGATDSANEVQK